MSKQNTAIYCLTASAFVICALLIVKVSDHFSSNAIAATVNTTPQTTHVTAKIGNNHDGVFVFDNTTGYVIVYNYDSDFDRVNYLARRDLRSLFSSKSKKTQKSDKDQPRRKVRER